MNDDIINRQIAIDAITDEHIVTNMDSVYDSELHRYKRAIHRILASLPSAEQHGQWIIDKYLSNIGTCSICGDQWGGINDMRYCPTCGAYMRGEQNE